MKNYTFVYKAPASNKKAFVIKKETLQCDKAEAKEIQQTFNAKIVRVK